MKNKLLISLLLTMSFLALGLPTNVSVENKPPTYPVDIMVKQAALPSFGIEINDAYTNDTIVLSEDPTFHFAFDFNVSWAGDGPGADEGVFGGGIQPENWFYDATQTRIVGAFNILIDDMNLGLSNYDPYGIEGTEQDITLDLTPGIHYLTAIAAEYMLPYAGAPNDTVELHWAQDVHMFYVIENAGDPLPTHDVTNVALNANGTTFTEEFTYSGDIPLEHPTIRATSLNDDDPYNPILSYEYNVSTDGEVQFDDSLGYLDVIKTGDGGVAWFLNDYNFAAGPQNLSTGSDNYAYLCAVSMGPHPYYTAYSTYYPTLKMDVDIVKIELVGQAVEYITEYVTVTETNTYTTTITEENTIIVTETKTEGIVETPFDFTFVLLPIIVLGVIGLTRTRRNNQ